MPSDSAPPRQFSSPISNKTWLSTIEDADKISVRNLSVTANSGYDVWNRQKRQPALLSITAFLKHSFDQAARSDTVDSSTVHYGVLSKKVQGIIEESSEWQSSFDLASRIHRAAYMVAGTSALKGCELNVFYPKACMHGDGAGFILSTTEEGYSTILYLKNVRISCIIGVNSNERKAKQPVVANLWIDSILETQADDYGKTGQLLAQNY